MRKKKQYKAMMETYSQASRICIPRYTYDAWKKCFPGTSREDYESCQRPYNLMEYLRSALSGYWGLFESRPDMDVSLILFDDDYFKWLGDAENTEEKQAEYTVHNPLSEEIMAKKLDDAGLNISDWVYTVPMLGVSKAKSVPSVMEKNTVEALENYINRLINDNSFSVYISPYIINTNDLFDNIPHVLTMADAWFKHRKQVTFGCLDTVTFAAENTLSMVHVPVVVREKIQGAGLKAGDILSYAGLDTSGYGLKPGWSLNLVDCMLDDTGEDPEFAGFTAPERLSSSEAGRMLSKEFGKIFCDTGMIEPSMNILINAENVLGYYDAVIGELKKDMRKTRIHIKKRQGRERA